MRNYVKYPKLDKGFSVINGELCEVALQDVFYTWMDEGLEQSKLEVSHKGKTHCIKPNNYYESEEDYRKGNTMPCHDVWFIDSHKMISKEDGVEYWTMDNGEPTKHFHRICCGHKKTNEPFHIDGMPDTSTIYKNRAECLEWNEYTISFEDGHKETRKGAGLLMQLTEEQRKAVKRAESAMRKAHALGVRFFHSYGETYAVNTNELKQWEHVYCEDVKAYKEDGYTEELDFQEDQMRVDMPIINSCEEYAIVFERK